MAGELIIRARDKTMTASEVVAAVDRATRAGFGVLKRAQLSWAGGIQTLTFTEGVESLTRPVPRS